MSGIGPKTALDVLSGTTVTSFKACVVAGDIAALSKTKGIGKKTAERIVVELKDKVGIAAAWEAAYKQATLGAGNSGARAVTLTGATGRVLQYLYVGGAWKQS